MEQFDARLLARRSVRKFTSQEIDRSVVDRILAMASTAPVGIPPGNKIGLALGAGYPVAHFQRGIRRQWADLRFG